MQYRNNPGPAYEPTGVLFVNHASILIKPGARYMLTDPWHQKPAFGSWLPTLPQYIHPAYMASLGRKFAILISHGLDDHCDDELLTIFNEMPCGRNAGVQVILSNF
jgi:L-ascorbate metabolism protein UlaG (beta-lactamase superfamily)